MKCGHGVAMAIPKDCKISGRNGQSFFASCLIDSQLVLSQYDGMNGKLSHSPLQNFYVTKQLLPVFICLVFTQINSTTSAQTHYILCPSLVMDLLPSGHCVNMKLLNVWIEYSVSLSPWLTCHFGWRYTRVSFFPFLFRGVQDFEVPLSKPFANSSKLNSSCNKFDGIGCATGLFSKPTSKVLLWLYHPNSADHSTFLGDLWVEFLSFFCSFDHVLQGFEFRVLKVLSVFRVFSVKVGLGLKVLRDKGRVGEGLGVLTCMALLNIDTTVFRHAWCPFGFGFT